MIIYKIIDYVFPAKTKWIDIGNCEVSGKYYLVQMRTTIRTNKKQFRKAGMGWINDYTNKPTLFKNSLLQIA